MMSGRSSFIDVKQIISEAIGNNVDDYDVLVDVGLDSLIALEVQGVVSTLFDVRLTPDIIFASGATIHSLATTIIEKQDAVSSGSSNSSIRSQSPPTESVVDKIGNEVKYPLNGYNKSVTVESYFTNTTNNHNNDKVLSMKNEGENIPPQYKPPSMQMLPNPSTKVDCSQYPSTVQQTYPLSNSQPRNVCTTLDASLDVLASQLMNPSTLMHRLEDRLLDKLLNRWQTSNNITTSNVNTSYQSNFMNTTVSMSGSPSVAASPFTMSLLLDGKGHIVLITGNGSSSANKSSLIQFIKTNYDYICSELRTRGGLLFRDCGLENAHDFRDVLEQFQSSGWRDYRGK